MPLVHLSNVEPATYFHQNNEKLKFSTAILLQSAWYSKKFFLRFVVRLRAGNATSQSKDTDIKFVVKILLILLNARLYKFCYISLQFVSSKEM